MHHFSSSAPLIACALSLLAACTSGGPQGEAVVVGQCADTLDNDGNGAIDCDDRNCAGYDGCPGGESSGATTGTTGTASPGGGSSSTGSTGGSGAASPSTGTGGGTSTGSVTGVTAAAGAPTCSADQSRCDGECVDLNAHPLHCASCGNACPGGVCASGSCITNTNCTEEPCVGFSYCDLADTTCKPGCALDNQCNANEICAVARHECTCDVGFHDCADVCVADDSVQGCGPSCTVCQPPANSTPRCTDDACDFDCNAGYFRCGGQCYAENDVVCDEASCSICRVPANGSAACSGSSCSISCDGGYQRCGQECYLETDVFCDDSCTACPVPANGAAACNGAACEFSCNVGYAACDGGCKTARGEACSSDDECCGSSGLFCFFGECTPFVPCTLESGGSLQGSCSDGYNCMPQSSSGANSGVCSYNCELDEDCEPGPQGAWMTCRSPGSEISYCEIGCPVSTPCPDGMECVDQGGDGSDNYCRLP